MDFSSFAAIEFAHAFEEERAYARDRRKWLIQWKDLRRAADEKAAATADAKRPAPAGGRANAA